MAQFSIHPIMSIVRNTVVLGNAALGALVVLALFECNAFIAVRFGIEGVFCKENRSNTLRTSRVHGPRPCKRHGHSRLHGPTRPVRGRVHGPFSALAVYTAVYTRIRVHHRYKAVYAPYTRPCTRPVRSRIHGPCTRTVHGSVNVRVHGPSCTWQVGLPGHVHVPRRHATAVCGPSRPCTRPVHSPFTTVYTAVFDGRVRAAHGRPTRAYVYTAVKKPCTRHAHVRVHGPRRHVAAVVHVHDRKAPCTRSCTRPIHSRVHGSCTAVYTALVHVDTCTRPYTCLLYTSPSPRDRTRSRMPSSA